MTYISPIRYQHPRQAFVRRDLVRPPVPQRVMELKKEVEAVVDNQQLLEAHDYLANPPCTVADIARLVARITNTPLKSLYSEDRHRPIVRARQLAMFLARKHTNRSLPEIGRRIGCKDHSTVLYSVRKVNERPQDFEPELSQAVAILTGGTA